MSLPAVFTLCIMIAAAWVADSNSDGCDKTGQEICSLGQNVNRNTEAGGGGRGGTIELETLAFEALARAVRAAGALIIRGLRPSEGDGAAALITVVSMCSVAFAAWPTFTALAEAELTYHVRSMKNKRRQIKKKRRAGL